MAITVSGTRIPYLSLTLQKEDGQFKLTGSYELMSNNGISLAKQEFNAYNGITLNLSADTHKKMMQFIAAVQTDINLTLGMEE